MKGKSDHSATRTLTQNDSALANYLDTLLGEIDDLDDVPSLQVVKEPLAEADKLNEGKAPNAAAACVPQRSENANTVSASDLPEWAAVPFQILRFRVNGVNLIVPLQSLTGIIPLDRPISHLPGQPAWNLGVVMHHDTKVVAVDTQRLLMPEGEFEQTGYSHLLLFGDGNWGLAVESLGDTTTVDKEAIRWRGEVVQQPWYGGIWVEELSVLLDVEGVMEILAA
ncbi:MAG: chemotaxis protein CheW [Candidatus Thiodiazotropha sp.]